MKQKIKKKQKKLKLQAFVKMVRVIKETSLFCTLICHSKIISFTAFFLVKKSMIILRNLLTLSVV